MSTSNDIRFSNDVLVNAERLINRDFNGIYLVLGSHIADLERIEDPTRRQLMSERFIRHFLPKDKVEPYTRKGKEFLARYWEALRMEGCSWLSENGSKYAGQALISGLALAISHLFPAPWNVTGSVLAIIASILIKAGIDVLCDQKQNTPP